MKNMKKKKRSARQDELLCQELLAEDGVDTRRTSRDTGSAEDKKKLLRLCSQVARVVSLSLAGDCGDPLLGDLEVLEVVPAPDASRLRVRVRNAADDHESDEIQERLERCSGLLRSEVARALNRRRAPELEFVLVETDA